MRSHSRKGEEQTGREHQSILRRRRRIIFLLSYLVLSLLQCFFILYILYIFYTCFYHVYYIFIILLLSFLLCFYYPYAHPWFMSCIFLFIFSLATNSHAQSMSPVSCRSKRVDDHSRFYANFRDFRGARVSRLTPHVLKPNADPVVLM